MFMRYLIIGILFFILGVGAFIGLQKANPQTFSSLQQKLMNPFKPDVKLRGDMKPFYEITTQITTLRVK